MFCLTFNLKENVFLVDYRGAILSYIKNAITKCDNGKYLKYFFDGRKQKDYCFSVIFSNPTFGKDKIIFSTNNNSKVGFILLSSFIAQKNKIHPLPNKNYISLKSIKNLKQEEIINSKAIFKTTLGSGLCVREHCKENNKDNYYVYNDIEFKEKFS